MKAPLHAAILAAFFAVPAIPAMADDTNNSPTTELDPVIVTATRTGVAESQQLASVTLITRNQIEQAQATDVAELLRFTAGVELGRSGGPGQQTSVFIRGANSSHTLVLIDGQRINRLTLGGATFENIAPDMIDHIEIVKGPRATLYGSDAIGGVINIITRRAEGTEAELRLRGGSERTADVGAFLGYGKDGNDISLSAQNQRTNGFPTVAGNSEDRGFRQSSFNLAGNTSLSGVKLGARVWDAWGTAEYFGFDPNTFLPTLPRSQDLHNLTAALDASFNPTQNWDSTLTIAHAEDRIDQRQSSDYLHNERPSLDWHNVFAIGSHNRVSFGTEAARETVSASSSGSPVRDQREVYTGYLQDELDYGRNHGLVAVSGQRDQAYGVHYNWNAEYGFDLFKTTRLIASAGSAFHAPTAFDRFGFGGNPNLKPESAREYEVGVRQQLTTSQKIDLRVFRNDIDDLIVVTCDVNFNCNALNVARYRNIGSELAYQLTTHDWSLDLTGTIQNPQDRTNDKPLLRRAKSSLAARLTRRFGDNYVGLDALASSRRPDVDLITGSSIYDGGYTLFNLTGGMKLGQHFNLEARVENLLDKHYQTAAGYNQPGATYYATLRYSY